MVGHRTVEVLFDELLVRLKGVSLVPGPSGLPAVRHRHWLTVHQSCRTILRHLPEEGQIISGSSEKRGGRKDKRFTVDNSENDTFLRHTSQGHSNALAARKGKKGLFFLTLRFQRNDE